jgi:hypothetical protein
MSTLSPSRRPRSSPQTSLVTCSFGPRSALIRAKCRLVCSRILVRPMLGLLIIWHLQRPPVPRTWPTETPCCSETDTKRAREFTLVSSTGRIICVSSSLTLTVCSAFALQDGIAGCNAASGSAHQLAESASTFFEVDSITLETAEIITPDEPRDMFVRTPIGSDRREVQAGMLKDSGATDAGFTDHLASAATASTAHVADGNPMLLGDRHQGSSGIHTCKFNRSNNLCFFVANPKCLLSLRAPRWYRRMQRGFWQCSPAGRECVDIPSKQ